MGHRQWYEEWEKEKDEQYQARKSKRENGGKANEEEIEKVVLARGSLLKLTKIPEDVERDEVKAAFGEHRADIAHVEMTDDRVAIVRFRSENAASVVKSKLEKLTIEGQDIEMSLIEGEEQETTQWWRTGKRSWTRQRPWWKRWKRIVEGLEEVGITYQRCPLAQEDED